MQVLALCKLTVQIIFLQVNRTLPRHRCLNNVYYTDNPFKQFHNIILDLSQGLTTAL